VVDASHADPEGQISAVREVLNDSGAGDLPEIIAINKADVADPVVVQMLHTRYPGSVTVSARTGAGIDDLLAAIADRLPRPEVDVQVTVPYSRGDLVSRIHEQGEVVSLEHGAQGSQVHARVDAALAHDLEGFATENA
jgi:GTP-binding protein HflX